MLGTSVVEAAPADPAPSASIATPAPTDKTSKADILFAAPPLSDSPESVRKRQTPPSHVSEPEGELPSAQDLRDAHVPVPQNLEDGNYDVSFNSLGW